MKRTMLLSRLTAGTRPWTSKTGQERNLRA